ncbi:hypothetical protein V1503_24105 [Bacillus sp. SCS-151]|uniref:hypothetical protein n=1 Tax=Nanhaiella sioensis TaxID=3115293 RepID=UPI00397CC56F
MKKIERMNLANQAIKNIEGLLKNDCKFLTNEGEKGIVTLMLNYNQFPRCEYERVVQTNYDEEGPVVKKTPNLLDNQKFDLCMESIEYLIRHFVSSSMTAVGNLQFTFVNGFIESCTIKGRVAYKDIEDHE